MRPGWLGTMTSSGNGLLRRPTLKQEFSTILVLLKFYLPCLTNWGCTLLWLIHRKLGWDQPWPDHNHTLRGAWSVRSQNESNALRPCSHCTWLGSYPKKRLRLLKPTLSSQISKTMSMVPFRQAVYKALLALVHFNSGGHTTGSFKTRVLQFLNCTNRQRMASPHLSFLVLQSLGLFLSLESKLACKSHRGAISSRTWPV